VAAEPALSLSNGSAANLYRPKAFGVELWASLCKEEQDIESPEWHGEVLAARKAKADAGEAQFLSVEELKERLRR